MLGPSAGKRARSTGTVHTWGLVRAPQLCRDLLASGALAGKLGAACCAGPGGVQLGSTISPETQLHPSALQPKGLGLVRVRLRVSTATPLPASLLSPELPFKAVWGHMHALCTSGLQVPVPVKHHRAVSLQLISAHGGCTLQPPTSLCRSPASCPQSCKHPVPGHKTTQACYSTSQPVSYPMPHVPISPLPASRCGKPAAPQAQRDSHSQVVT